MFFLRLFLSLILSLSFVRVIFLPKYVYICPSLSFFYSLSLVFFITFLHSLFPSRLLYLCFPFSPCFLLICVFMLFMTFPFIHVPVFLSVASFEQLAHPGAGHLKLHTNIESVDVTVLCLICSRGCPLRVPGRKQNDWFLLSWRAHI